MTPTHSNLLNKLRFNSDGLIPAIAQDATSGKVLMLAWMNLEAVALTIEKKQAVYWSRSRQALWHKGETSGNMQKVIDMYLDCDGDTLLLMVEQVGGIACHTGRQSCFYQKNKDQQWQAVDPILKDPKEMYPS